MVATLPRGRDGRRRRKWLMFVLIELDWSPHTCKSRYRRRFGIECSYRQGRQVRIITNSMNPALRFFYLGLSLGLVNVWIALRWVFARQLGCGPRRVDPERFRFHRFVHFLMRAIEHAFGVIMSIPTHRSPQFVIYWICLSPSTWLGSSKNNQRQPSIRSSFFMMTCLPFLSYA